MKTKCNYQHPTMQVIIMHQQQHLLVGTAEEPAGGPKADFMLNPGIGETEDEAQS